MKRRTLSLLLLLALMTALIPVRAGAVYAPPTQYSAPVNVGVVFNGDDLDADESGRWSFDIGLGATDEIRQLVTAYDDGRMDEAGYDSFDVSVQGDYKLDNGSWRSELSGYDDWVFTQSTGFSSIEGVWASGCHIYDAYFYEAIPDGILPGGKAFFDTHTMSFRVRFSVSFYHSDSGESYEYVSPWSSAVSYTNDMQAQDPAALINHAPALLSAALKKDDDGYPYLDFQAGAAHDEIQLLNSMSDQRVYTNVWVRVNGGAWTDAGTYLWLKEQFTVDADDYFPDDESFDAAVYEVKFRYSFDLSYYPSAGQSGTVYSPFSNIVSHGMPAYEGASNWARAELDLAAVYGLITDRIKDNMSAKITREEFAEIAVKLYEIYTGTSADAGSANFSDTTNPEILKAANLGLVTGIGGGKFAPAEMVTREQMATILLRALKVIAPDADYSFDSAAKFSDDGLVESWARDGVYFCFKANIVAGVGNNRFDADGNATREQGVLVCKRAFEYFT
jgi:hypothetical protein